MWCIALPSSRSCQLSLCKLTHVNKFFCKHSNWVLFLYPWPHRSWWISSLFHTSDFLAKCYFKFSSRSQSPRNYMHMSISNWLLFKSEVILYVCVLFSLVGRPFHMNRATILYANCAFAETCLGGVVAMIIWYYGVCDNLFLDEQFQLNSFIKIAVEYTHTHTHNYLC